jgi:hypothetical protein
MTRGQNSNTVFTMTGGEITRNSAKAYIDSSSGQQVGGFPGGLIVHGGATFNMIGGSITNNNSQGNGPNNVVFGENTFTGEMAIINTTGGNIQGN